MFLENSNTALPKDSKKAATHESDSDDGDVESDGPDQPKHKISKQDVSNKTSTRRRRKRFRHKRKQQSNSLKVKPGDRVCVEIINTKTRADVMWQDGTLETNVDTLDLIAIFHIDDHQFLPGYIVNDKRGKKKSKEIWKSIGARPSNTYAFSTTNSNLL